MPSLFNQLQNLGNNLESTFENSIIAPSLPTFNKPLDVSASSIFSKISPNGKYRTLMVSGNPSRNVSPLVSSKSLDEEGKVYPLGIAPEVDFYQSPDDINENTGYPTERGNILDAGIIRGGTPKYGTLRDNNDILNNDIPAAFTAFDDKSGQEFLHHLDKLEIPLKPSDIYLSSFVSTSEDNEDPVSFGYDIIIDYDSSPLFNGAIEEFINNFSSYSELKSRLEVVDMFKTQFFKFFKINSPTSVGNSVNTAVRTYYLKKITGLDNLTEGILPYKSKQFINYGSNDDILVLTLNEDISVNMGYLAYLYKLLTYSKRHGKKMFPDNLLRFDMEIVVTEARKFNRVSKNGDNIDQYADLMSRYRYKIYECQFFFDKLSHGDGIDMWGLNISDGFDIKINYKFSTMKFEKVSGFDFDNQKAIINNGSSILLDNSKIDLTKIDGTDTNNTTIENNTITHQAPQYDINRYSIYSPNTVYISKNPTTEDFYAKRIQNMDRIQNTNTLNLREQLFEKTIEKIKSEFNLTLSNIGGMILGRFMGGYDYIYNEGYEINLPAFYANRLLTNGNNTLIKALGLKPNFNIYTTIRDINTNGLNTSNLGRLLNNNTLIFK